MLSEVVEWEVRLRPRKEGSMSILIKGMEMPTRCEKCDLAYDDDGYFACPFTKAFYKSKQRPSWCPLVEVKPHGRLIDADAVMEDVCFDADVIWVWRVTDAPTIIEEEK